MMSESVSVEKAALPSVVSDGVHRPASESTEAEPANDIKGASVERKP